MKKALILTLQTFQATCSCASVFACNIAMIAINSSCNNRMPPIQYRPILLQRSPSGSQHYRPKLMQIAPAINKIQVPKVSFINFFVFFLFSIFSHTYKNLYKTWMHAMIKLKLGKQNGHIITNLHTNFSANPLKLWLLVRLKQDQFVVTPTG